MTYYVTKHALTQGIVPHDNAKRLECGGIMVNHGCFNSMYVAPKDWTEDLADAQERADALRLKKIAALKRQIKALEEKSFK